HVASGGSRVDGMISGLGADDAAPIPRLFEESDDVGVAPITRHLDQATVVKSVPLRMGACVQQALHRFEAPFAHSEMNRRGVPVLRQREMWISLEQSAQRDHVAFGCGRDGVPSELPGL